MSTPNNNCCSVFSRKWWRGPWNTRAVLQRLRPREALFLRDENAHIPPEDTPDAQAAAGFFPDTLNRTPPESADTRESFSSATSGRFGRSFLRSRTSEPRRVVRPRARRGVSSVVLPVERDRTSVIGPVDDTEEKPHFAARGFFAAKLLRRTHSTRALSSQPADTSRGQTPSHSPASSAPALPDSGSVEDPGEARPAEASETAATVGNSQASQVQQTPSVAEGTPGQNNPGRSGSSEQRRRGRSLRSLFSFRSRRERRREGRRDSRQSQEPRDPRTAVPDTSTSEDTAVSQAHVHGPRRSHSSAATGPIVCPVCANPFAASVTPRQVLVHIDGCLVAHQLSVQLLPEHWEGLHGMNDTWNDRFGRVRNGLITFEPEGSQLLEVPMMVLAPPSREDRENGGLFPRCRLRASAPVGHSRHFLESTLPRVSGALEETAGVGGLEPVSPPRSPSSGSLTPSPPRRVLERRRYLVRQLRQIELHADPARRHFLERTRSELETPARYFPGAVSHRYRSTLSFSPEFIASYPLLRPERGLDTDPTAGGRGASRRDIAAPRGPPRGEPRARPSLPEGRRLVPTGLAPPWGPEAFLRRNTSDDTTDPVSVFSETSPTTAPQSTPVSASENLGSDVHAHSAGVFVAGFSGANQDEATLPAGVRAGTVRDLEARSASNWEAGDDLQPGPSSLLRESLDSVRRRLEAPPSGIEHVDAGRQNDVPDSAGDTPGSPRGGPGPMPYSTPSVGSDRSPGWGSSTSSGRDSRGFGAGRPAAFPSARRARSGSMEPKRHQEGSQGRAGSRRGLGESRDGPAVRRRDASAREEGRRSDPTLASASAARKEIMQEERASRRETSRRQAPEPPINPDLLIDSLVQLTRGERAGNEEAIAKRAYKRFLHANRDQFVALANFPFSVKKDWLYAQLSSMRVHFANAWVVIDVRRDRLLQMAFDRLRCLSPADFHKEFKFKFQGECGADAGGPTREFFTLISQKILDPNAGLFQFCDVDEIAYRINPNSAVNEHHLEFFRFVGLILGKALFDKQMIGAPFCRPLLKHLLQRDGGFQDLEFFDSQVHRSLQWIRAHPIDGVLDTSFTVTEDFFGETKVIPLKEGGEFERVTDANKEEYISLIARHKLVYSVRDQLRALQEGFWSVVPLCLLRIFDDRELDLLLNGQNRVDVDDWKRNTQYSGGYCESDPIIQWFWDVVGNIFNDEERGRLLQFCTGTSRVPAEGFRVLESNRGQLARFTLQPIERIPGQSPALLPRAHTCFNRVDLPKYSSREELLRYLRMAIEVDHLTGFGVDE
uniref:HECT-type E3 ubiquitin transferase n=1 Tax=Toxoplasma gondii COUG TaxID=1074873 RepID=A0A2G8XQA7_TOXGO|nr:HECT-domain (ubiquitin-transferase) domain-containing protein [Toxoplasma gondii COUG]